MSEHHETGLACFEALVAGMQRNINVEAVITEAVRADYARDPVATLLRLGETLELRPEWVEDPVAAAAVYSGPALGRLQNGNWVCLLKLSQLTVDGDVSLYDPLLQSASKMLAVGREQVMARLTGGVMLFRQLQPIDFRRQTGLFCLVNIARHHQLSADVRRLMHDHAIGAEEPGEALLEEIAAKTGLHSRPVALPWKKLFRLGQAFPCMIRRRDGRYAILCGVQRGDEAEAGEPGALVIDPSLMEGAPGDIRRLSQGDYAEQFSGRGLLLKRTYRLSDEEQPFGLRWFIPEFLKLRGIFAQIALSVVMITLVSLAVPLFFQIVVDKVIVHHSVNTLHVLGAGVIAAILFNGVLEYLKSYYLLFATNKIDMALASRTFAHLMRLPLDFFERMSSGVLLKHLQQTEKIRGFLSGNLFFTFLDLLSLAIFIPLLLLYSPLLTAVVLAFSLLMALVIASLVKPFQHRLNELYRAEGKRQSMLVESIHGIRTVKALALEPVQAKLWDETSAYAITSYFRVGKISLSARALSQVLELLMTVAVVWFGATLVFSGQLSVGALIAFQMLSGRVTGPLVKIVGLIHEYQQIALSVQMLGSVMNTAAEPERGGVSQPLRGSLQFEQVHFRYGADLPLVIRNFSLAVQSGQVVGIVGRSGSGKSTLAKLLQGLYPLHSGLIKIDGMDIREISLPHLRSSIGVVLQDNYFFSGSVRDNIALTKPGAALEEILYVARLAGADEFVQKLPRGYDTFLEENACNLSGGQRQRLAIARALLPNPPILVFDEATSALDPESEAVIQSNLVAIARGRTVVIISHRLSFVRGAHRIVVLDQGELSACGTHEELLRQPGTYRDFWKQQMERTGTA